MNPHTFVKKSVYLKRYIPLLSLLVCFFSCNNNTIRTRLDEIETYVYEQPDRAKATLDAMDATIIRNKKQNARYILLKVMAINRLHIDTTDLQLIVPAAEYFEKKGQDRYRNKAEYCLGWIYYNQQDWPNSLLHLKKAEYLTKEDEDSYFSAILYSALANVSSKLFLTEEELRYSKKGYESSQKLAKPELSRNALFTLAAAYGAKAQFAEADSLFLLAIRQLNVAEEASMKELVYAAHAAISKSKNDPHLSCRLYEQALSSGATLSQENSYAYAYALMLCGRLEEMQSILNGSMGNGSSVETYFWNYKISRRQEDYKVALESLENYCNKQIRELIDNVNHSVYQSLSLQNKALADESVAKTNRFRLIIILILAVALASIGLLSLLLNQRKIQHEREREKQENAIEESERLLSLIQEDHDTLQATVQNLVTENGALSEKIQSLQASFCAAYQNQLTELGRLCERGISQDDRKARKDRAIEYSSRQVEKLLSEISEGEGKQRELEAEIDRSLDDVVAKLRSDFPELSDKDVLFLCYIILHFHTSTIAFLTGYTKDNVRQKRHRLSQLISSRKTPNSYLYELLLK